VLSPHSLNRRAERGGVVSSATAENRLQVHLEQRHARPGQRLRGVVWAAPPPAGTAPPVVVELLRREENSRLYHQDRGFGIEWTVERHVLSDGLSGPDWATLPSTSPFPPVHVRRSTLGHSGVRWLVRARTGAPRRRGDSVAEEVNVFTGRDDARPQ
jgi:hypothetical protein